MSIWLAVAFFCTAQECAFWKAEELFPTKAHCEVVLNKEMDILEASNIRAAGVCMDIKVTRT
jgi:hypothetical protein